MLLTWPPRQKLSLGLQRNGFQKLDKIKDANRQSNQLEELTWKMRECKRLIKEFDREVKDEEGRNPQEVNKQLNDEKQSMHTFFLQINELNLCGIEKNVHEYHW